MGLELNEIILALSELLTAFALVLYIEPLIPSNSIIGVVLFYALFLPVITLSLVFVFYGQIARRVISLNKDIPKEKCLNGSHFYLLTSTIVATFTMEKYYHTTEESTIAFFILAVSFVWTYFASKLFMEKFIIH